MKCKLNRGCNLKLCNKRQWCKYESWNIPRAGLSEARTKRRMAQISDQTRLIAENSASYEAGFKGGLALPSGLARVRLQSRWLFARRKAHPPDGRRGRSEGSRV